MKFSIFHFPFSIFSAVLLFSAFYFLIFAPVFAAELFIESAGQEVKVGQQFEVELFVNTAQEDINAFEGKIIFPGDILDLKEIRDGDTIVNFWIEKPHQPQATGDKRQGEIVFSGITPGGFNGTKGFIFSAIFEGKKEGTAKFEIGDARTLRNDGTGSAAPLMMVPSEITVSSGTPAEIPLVPKIKDTEPPEAFVPEIAKDPTLFEDKWFVVFATQDKSSGVDHYEIKESRQRILSIFGKWVTAESPYVLADQELRSFIWIKAVDKAGNVRIEKVLPQNPLAWYEDYGNWIIMIIVAGFIAYIGGILWKRHKNQ